MKTEHLLSASTALLSSGATIAESISASIYGNLLVVREKRQVNGKLKTRRFLVKIAGINPQRLSSKRYKAQLAGVAVNAIRTNKAHRI